MKSIRILYYAIFYGLIPTVVFGQWDSLESTKLDYDYRRLKGELEYAKNKADSSLIATKLIEFGDFYRQNEAVNQALLHYQNAIDYLGDKDTALVYIHLNSGIIQLHLKSYQSALNYFKRGQHLAQNMSFKRGEAMCSGYIGSCYEKLGQFEKAIDFQNKGLQAFKKLADSTGLALTHENLGSVYEDLGRYSLAKRYFEAALSYLQTQTKEDLYLNIRNNIADIYRKTGEFEKALDLSQQNLEMALDLNNEHQIESAYKDISKTLYGLESYQEAYLNLELSDSINEVILQNQNRQQLTALESLYDAKTKNARIEILLKENEISAVQNRVLWLGLMLLCTVAGGIYWHQRSVKKHQLSLAKYKNKALEAELNAERLEQQSLESEIKLKTNSLSNYSLSLAQKNKTLSTVAHTLSNIKGRKRLDVDRKLT